MQTFLPYPDFVKSAQSLDYRRLGKQRIECKQIYFALTRPGYGWANHPAVKMWKGYEASLVRYAIAICFEWRARGYQDEQLGFFLRLACDGENPPWLGDEQFHLSHRAKLVEKNPTYYQPQFGDLPIMEYVWPVL